MELNGWRGRKDMGEVGRVESAIRIYSIVHKRKLFSKRKNERKRKQNQHCKNGQFSIDLEFPGDQDTSLGMWLRMLPED